jgi:hypothetical protein
VGTRRKMPTGGARQLFASTRQIGPTSRDGRAPEQITRFCFNLAGLGALRRCGCGSIPQQRIRFSDYD